MRAVVFDFADSRAGHHAQAFLGDWRGTLVCDDYAGYKALFGKGVVESGCLAHARRKFHELWANHQSRIAEEALALFGQLYEVERQVRELDADERRRIRQLKAALLCVRQARSGGLSSIVSTPAIFNAILQEHPEHMPVLLRGFPYDRKAQEGPGEPQQSARIPVFVTRGQRLSSRYARSYISTGAQKTVPLSPEELAALDCFGAIAHRDGMAMYMDFKPGDIQLLNNLTTLHGRTSYEDHPGAAKRRFLWRLWLHLGDEAPWSQEDDVMRWAFARFGNLGLSVTEWQAARSPQATSVNSI